MSKWAQKSNTKFTYTPSSPNAKSNEALKYANTLIKNNNANVNMLNDYDEIIKNGCIYIPKFFGPSNDMTMFNKLRDEIDVNKMVDWSKHQKYENPQFSDTFNEIINTMAKYFNVKVLQTRMNYYKDATAYKPMHKDSHAYYTDENGVTMKENFTMGASFGYTRALDFIHDETGKKFTFPQKTNDVFCFNDKVNDKFMHGVPKVCNKMLNDKNSERISVIAWGIKYDI
jgi:hypothetical protein